jgi:hypothetical protein
MTVVEEFRKCTRPLVTVMMAGALVWFTYKGILDPKVFGGSKSEAMRGPRIVPRKLK